VRVPNIRFRALRISAFFFVPRFDFSQYVCSRSHSAAAIAAAIATAVIVSAIGIERIMWRIYATWTKDVRIARKPFGEIHHSSLEKTREVQEGEGWKATKNQYHISFIWCKPLRDSLKSCRISQRCDFVKHENFLNQKHHLSIKERSTD